VGDRKAEEEPIAGLWAATIPGPPAKTRQRFRRGGAAQRGARPVDAQQARGLRDTA